MAAWDLNPGAKRPSPGTGLTGESNPLPKVENGPLVVSPGITLLPRRSLIHVSLFVLILAYRHLHHYYSSPTMNLMCSTLSPSWGGPL